MKFLGRKTTKTEKTSAPKTSKAKSAKAVVRKRAPTHEEIAIRSYELYLARGAEPGHAEEDWLQAERELSA
ncbi:MAG TPA: DUF2934 domain-containing protein [Polyangia bacterium]|nr:DUF2934 domain-containing protein [Polyangia bacterium]